MMDAVKFILEKERMCKEMDSCLGCKLYSRNNGLELTCDGMLKEYPKDAVAIVEKWSEENPTKTLKDDFLERYPNAELNGYDAPLVCAKSVYGSAVANCNAYYTCTECWNRPLSEVE